MIRLITKILLVALALLAASTLIPGIVINSVYIAIIASIILGLLNLVVRPIILILTLPINLITLGLFTFVINAAIFGFAASFIEGFSVEGIVPALLGSIFVSLVSSLGNRLI